jgi:Short C-terminal domain
MPLMRRGPGLVRGAARVGVAAGVAGRVRHHQDQKWAAQDQAAYEQEAPQAAPAPAPAAAPASGGGDYTAELEKLAKLRDEGVITSEDFEAKKKQLLGV